MNGWIKIHRKMINNPIIWKSSDPYDRRSAWIDLLLMVNHDPANIMINNHLIHIDRGQTWTSFRQLADRWHWSIGKVRRYADCLVREKMLTLKAHTDGTLLTVVNYGFYQGARHTDEYTNDTQTEHQQTRGQTTNKNIKNDNKDQNKGKRTTESQSDMFNRLIIGRALSQKVSDKLREWIKYKQERREPYTETGMNALITMTVNHAAAKGSTTVCDVISLSMSSNYKGIAWERMNSNSSNNKSVGRVPISAQMRAPERTYDMDELELKLLASN